MSFDNLIQVVIVAAFIIFWLVGGKKKARTRSRESPRVDPLPQAPPGEPKLTPTERLIREALGLSTELQPRIPETEAPSLEFAAPEAPSLEFAAPEAQSLEFAAPEAISLETLDAAGAESHVEFHQKYIREFKPTAVRRASGPDVPTLSPRSVRDGIIWQVILGPPKGLE